MFICFGRLLVFLSVLESHCYNITDLLVETQDTAEIICDLLLLCYVFKADGLELNILFY